MRKIRKLWAIVKKAQAMEQLNGNAEVVYSNRDQKISLKMLYSFEGKGEDFIRETSGFNPAFFPDWFFEKTGA